MRLWHQKLIPYLPRQQLLGQHRECCALRGKGWDKKHSTVDYVFKYSLPKLYRYHMLVINEMMKRGYKVTEDWLEYNYRGKELGHLDFDIGTENKLRQALFYDKSNIIYSEHNDEYLQECLDNLRGKGINIKVE